MKITDRIKHAWNAFNGETFIKLDYGPSSSRPSHKTFNTFRPSTLVAPIYNRIALDVAMTKFKHVKINPDNEDIKDMNTGLNNCLTVEANIDQTHMQFIQDLVYSMLEEGVVAVVPVDTTISPEQTGGYDIDTMRVGKIVNWFPNHVEIQLYNERTGQNERILMSKKSVAIIENPLYSVVNDENSTLKRLLRKLSELDDSDWSGRLDLFISVPYGIKTETQKQMAEKRIKDIENQLRFGKNGIAYLDGTEKVTQLNRPANDQLPEEVTRLMQEFYNQTGLTKSIFDGTANESQLRAYYSRAIDPIIENIIAEFNRKFLTKTARTQGQTIEYYRDMFKFIPIENLANLGDSFRRNSIASSNELRKIVGLKRSNDPRADELYNPNIADDRQIGSLPKPEAPKTEEHGSLTPPTNVE